MKKQLILKIKGMHCQNCSKKIKDNLESIGVKDLRVSFEREEVTCITDNQDAVIDCINGLGYIAEIAGNGAAGSSKYKGISIALLVILGFYLIIKNTVGFDNTLQLQEQAGYGILFVLGIATSLHCLTMCGGIVVSQSMAFDKPIKGALLYNLGRVAAYTAIGAIVGGIGSAISFSPIVKSFITIFAGVFMILMGLSMLQSFVFLRHYIKLPALFKNINVKRNGKTPLLIGLASGLMPCGPLQTMQIYALGTGSIVDGALAMFVFSLGTVPLMLGLGAISGYISSRLSRKILKLSSVLVIFLGLIIVNRGLALQGNHSLDKLINSEQADSQIFLPDMMNGFQVINTSANQKGYEPNYFILEKGKPVNWVIWGDAITNCNNEIVIPKLNISKKLKAGHNIIKFTPDEIGELGFSCWMGMLDGKFIVVEDINDIPENLEAIPPKPVNCCTN